MGAMSQNTCSTYIDINNNNFGLILVFLAILFKHHRFYACISERDFLINSSNSNKKVQSFNFLCC